MIKKVKQHLLLEWKRMVRFGFVGAVTFFLYLGLYAMARHLWPEANHTWLNFLSNALAAVFNFFAHRHYTFKSAMPHGQQAVRYLIVLASTFALQSALFWFLHERVQLNDYLVAVLVGLCVPLYTYLMSRFFTFRHAVTPSHASPEFPRREA